MLIPRRWPHVLPGEFDKLYAPGATTGHVSRFESELARLAGTRHAICLNSGRQGMALILGHLGIGPGDEVIVPAYTLGALIPLVEKFGATAIPAEVAPETFNVTRESVASRISSRTRAIIVLHTFGTPAPIQEIAIEAEAHGIPIVEDCAHALGATLGGKAVGSFGRAGFYSFEITKPVNTYGGGAVVTDDDALAAFIRGQIEDLPYDMDGLKAKVNALKTERLLMGSGLAWPILYLLVDPRTRGPLSALYRNRQRVPSGDAAFTPEQARLGTEKLSSIEERIGARNERVDLYRRLLDPTITLQAVPEGARSSWYFCVARLPMLAEQVRLSLLRRAVDTAVGEEVADDVATPRGYPDCPNTATLAHHAMALPMYESLPLSSVERVAKALNRIVRARG